MKRPFGVTGLALIALIAGIAEMLVSFADFSHPGLLGAGAAAVAGTATMPQSQVLALGLATLLFVLSCLLIVFAVGALRLRPWAWGLGVALTILTIVDTGLTAATAGHLTVGDGFSVVVAILVLVYLSSPRVKAAFGQK
jgi:hypothetical protein